MRRPKVVLLEVAAFLRWPTLLASLFLAGGLAACGSGTPEGAGVSNGTLPEHVEDAGSADGSSDGSAQDGSILDSGHNEGDANTVTDALSGPDSSAFGHVLGQDPCVDIAATGRSAWYTNGRCSARPARTPVVSSQTGLVTKTKQPSFNSSLNVTGQPIFASNGTVFTSLADLFALNPNTFSVKWEGSSALWRPSLGLDDALFTSGTNSTHAESLNPSTGATNWTHDFLGLAGDGFVLRDGSVMFSVVESPGFSRLVLKVLHANDGTDSWSVDIGSATLGRHPSLLASASLIYATPVSVGGIIAISPVTHAVVWSTTEHPLYVALDERAHRLLAITCATNSITRFNSDDGSVVSTHTTSLTNVCADGISAIALGVDHVYTVSQLGQLRGIDAATGAVWTASGLGTYPSDPIVGGDGTVYVSAKVNDQLYAYAFAADGTPKWTTHLGTDPSTTDVGAVMSIDGNGFLYASFAGNKVLYQMGP